MVHGAWPRCHRVYSTGLIKLLDYRREDVRWSTADLHGLHSGLVSASSLCINHASCLAGMGVHASFLIAAA